MNREEILDRYRRLRAISAHHHSAALKFLAGPALMGHAKRLGLAVRRTLVAESEEEMTLAFDLALYTAKEGRSRALDRYARAARLVPGSDEARMLDAMRAARFSVWRVEQRHATVGLIVTDILREVAVWLLDEHREASAPKGMALWLLDEHLEASAPKGMAFAGRLSQPEHFAMTCGVVVPVTPSLIKEVMLDTLTWRRGDPEHVAQDPRFATAIYRAAIDNGTMEAVAYA